MTPNIVAYGAACVASGLKSAEAALDLLEEMELKSLKRNLIICNIHLTSYAAGTHWQEALVLLEEMLSDSELPEPNLISLREVSEAVGSACGLHSRELFGRLQCLVDDVLMPNGSDRASFKKRKGFSSLVPLNAAIEAMELLDSHDSLSAGSVFALQGQMLPVRFALQRLAQWPWAFSAEESIRSLESFFNLGLSKTLPGSLEDLGVARHGGVAWVGVARRCSLPGMKPMMDPVAQGLVAWRAASLEVKGGGPARHRQIQRANAVVRYGRDEGPGGELLLPVTVEHDRSRHAERRALVSLIALCGPKKELLMRLT